MPKKRWSPMTPGEQRVWQATYGAAFASDFILSKDRHGWGVAVQLASAEVAGQIADMAVGNLRVWRREENRQLGHCLKRSDSDG